MTPAAVREALEWYRDYAAAITRHMAAKNDQAVLACVTALSLDGGKRAHGALIELDEQEGG